jgi:hypothetical protein
MTADRDPSNEGRGRVSISHPGMVGADSGVERYRNELVPHLRVAGYTSMWEDLLVNTSLRRQRTNADKTLLKVIDEHDVAVTSPTSE